MFPCFEIAASTRSSRIGTGTRTRMAIYNALTREIYGSGKDKLGGKKEVWYVPGIIYNSKSGHTQLKWRHVRGDQGRLSGEASTNTMVNLYEAGALDKSFIRTIAAQIR